ncbi:carbohydrate ABC transporter permease [Chloroflexi bacterium TSY]|nr:carbohydrate ABC transporter permease [Chloroflexi bacterium TSY]
MIERRTLIGYRIQNLLNYTLIYAILIAGACVTLAPLAWMISTSLKKRSAVFRFPPEWIPDPVLWTNYPEALTLLPFGTFFVNTVIITFLAVLGELVSSSVVAYSFARLRWKGRNLLFIIVLATMMLPRQVTLIPVFIIFRNLDWINTFRPLIVPSWFGIPFFIFLLRQFYMTIPFDLDDAAAIDGCSRFGVFWRIVLPLSKPALAAVAIFSFQFHWNDFFQPLIYLFDKEKFTLALGLRFFQGNYGTDWHYLMAASLVVMLPVILVFFFAQKIFIQGVVYTGFK